MVSGKGKEKVPDGGKGKRKWSGKADDDKTGRKRSNRGVVKFFDDEAYQVDEDEDSSSDDSFFDDLEEEFPFDLNNNDKTGKKVPIPPFIPKEEEMSEEELERMLGERYKPGSGYVTYAEDGYEQTSSDIFVPSSKDPTIWKVKCVVGRERYSALCLMQKFADLDYLGTKLQIISACALDHIKGFIVIEADKQQDIYEACKGLSSIYASKVTAVPDKELPRLLSVKSKSSAITEGMFARVKNGKYRGDLAEVVAVNNDKKKVTVKLIPRIDLKAMAEKFGGGIPTKRTAIPAQRLICSSELEEFRPLIQSRRDRETNLMFEVLDGMMLKDGYLYKKISMDSLSFWGITPTEDELLKFEPSKKDESTDVQWLSQLFGEKKKKEKEVKASNKSGKGGEKSEGSSSAFIGNNFEVHDLVFFGRKDFGVVIGLEKDDTVKIIKESPEGPSVVNVKPSEVKSATFDKKLFSVLDRNSNTLTVNDNVRVLDGPLKDKQGVIKKIYKGILFLCDESEQENDGYTCVKAQLCEKVNHSGDALNEQDSEHVPSCFADLTSSPKTPLSPDKSLQERDSKTNFKRDDGTFSVGQTLRIRVGPLKGYICRVLAVRRTDVTVKLDSQHRILTVKSEHLTEVRGRNTVTAQGEESVKPFDFLGAQDGASGWMNGADAGGSTERSSWSTFPSSSSSLWKGSGSGDPADNDAKKGTEDSWQIKETPADNSSWGAAAAAANKSESGQADGWGKPAEPQGDSSGGWGKPVEPQEDSSGGWGKSVVAKEDSSGGWGKPVEPKEDSSGGWGKPVKPQEDSSGGWGKPVKPQEDSSGGWGKPVGPQEDSAGGWGKPVKPQEDSSGGWGKPVEPQPESGAWGNAGGASSQANVESGGWAISTDNGDSQTGGWNKPKSVGADSGSAWGKSEGTSSWGKKDDATQETSWGRSNTFDGGRDSGGRRGGRGRGRGGRDNYGWGRSFDQGQSGSWNKGQSGGFGDGGNTSSWSSDQGGGWGSKSNEDKDGQRSGLTDSGKNSSWGSDSAGGWGNSTANEGGKSGGWGNANATGKDEEPSWNQNAKKDGGGSEWGAGAGILGKEPKPNEDNKSSWNSATTSSSGWGNNKASEESGGWNKKSGDGGNDGSSSSWKGNWSKSESGGNQDTGWGSKSSWSSGGGFGGGNNQDDTSGDGGGGWRGGRGGRGGDRGGWSSGGAFGGGNNQDDTSGDGGGGGGWRGGRGGRGGDRGGFRGRGRSDRGGFGGRDGSGRGRFGGRGSDGGGYGGGGRGEGFHGRGGFRGRGRGDWNNREDNSNNDGGGWKNSSGGGSSWNSSGGGGNSWSNSGGGGSSWNNSGGDNNRGSSWSRPKDNTSTGGWGSPSKDAGGSGGWGSSSKDAGGSGGWGSSNASASKDAGGAGGAGDWGSSNASDKDAGGSGGWGSANALEKKDAGGSGGWGSSNASDKKDAGGSGGWGSSNASDKKDAGGSGGWGSSNASDKKDAGGSGGWGSSDASDKKGAGGSGGWGPSDASANKDAGGSGGWGSGGSGKGGW